VEEVDSICEVALGAMVEVVVSEAVGALESLHSHSCVLDVVPGGKEVESSGEIVV
jgi:hypothetical protein